MLIGTEAVIRSNMVSCWHSLVHETKNEQNSNATSLMEKKSLTEKKQTKQVAQEDNDSSPVEQLAEGMNIIRNSKLASHMFLL